jgi:hypothetical protein
VESKYRAGAYSREGSQAVAKDRPTASGSWFEHELSSEERRQRPTKEDPHSGSNCSTTLLEAATANEPLLKIQMGIVENRSFGHRELLATLEANVQEAARTSFSSAMPIFALIRVRVPGCLTYFDTRLLIAGQALNAIRPAHLFQEIAAGFRG